MKLKKSKWPCVLVGGQGAALQPSERAADYFYPTLKAGAAVSKVNNYSDSVAALLQSQTNTNPLSLLQYKNPLEKFEGL